MGGEGEGCREKGEYPHAGSPEVTDSGQGEGEYLCGWVRTLLVLCDYNIYV